MTKSKPPSEGDVDRWREERQRSFISLAHIAARENYTTIAVAKAMYPEKYA